MTDNRTDYDYTKQLMQQCPDDGADITFDTVSLLAETSMQSKILDFIYEWLANQWGYPCDYSFDGKRKDVSSELYENCNNWCEDCNNHTIKDCWKKYLEMKFNERR